MPRPLRILTSATALALTASLVSVSAGSADAADAARARSDRPSHDVRPAPRSGDGVRVTTDAAVSRSFVRLGGSGPSGRATSSAPSARGTTWPIGGGRAGLTATTVPSPTAAPGSSTRAQMAHYRVYGGVMEGVVDLAAAPDPADPATLAVIVMRWGTISGTTCTSPAGAGIAFDNTDTDTVSNPVYDGARITVKPTQFPPARTATWNCAFVDSRSSDGTTLYDDLIGRASLFRQKPLLLVKVKDRRLKARGFTRVPIVVRNSTDTIATAPRVRLRVKTQGVAVRYNPRVGTIKPGGVQRGAIYVKDTRPGIGRLTLVFSSKTYRKRVKLVVRPTTSVRVRS